MSIVPKLGLIIVNQLQDFSEHWLEIRVVQNSQLHPFYDVRTLSGTITHQAACRFIIESLNKRLHKRACGPPEQVGSTLRFIINLGLSSELLESRSHMSSVSEALVNLLESFLPPQPPLALA